MKQVLIAIDQLINTLLGGWADETLSARIYRNTNKSWWWNTLHKVVDTIFFWQDNHCYVSYLNENARTQLPKTYRNKDN